MPRSPSRTTESTSPGEFAPRFDVGANDGGGRTEFGAVLGVSAMAGFDRLELDLDGVVDRDWCVRIAENADAWEGRMHEDSHNFDHMWFPDGGYAVPACGGRLKFGAPPRVIPVDGVESECDFVRR